MESSTIFSQPSVFLYAGWCLLPVLPFQDRDLVHPQDLWWISEWEAGNSNTPEPHLEANPEPIDGSGKTSIDFSECWIRRYVREGSSIISESVVSPSALTSYHWYNLPFLFALSILKGF